MLICDLGHFFVAVASGACICLQLIRNLLEECSSLFIYPCKGLLVRPNALLYAGGHLGQTRHLLGGGGCDVGDVRMHIAEVLCALTNRICRIPGSLNSSICFSCYQLKALRDR